MVRHTGIPAIRVALIALLAMPQPAWAAPEPSAILQSVIHPDIITRHHGMFGRRRINYTANVESTVVPDAIGRPAARIVSFSYLADQPGKAAQRPVMFLFNGGPIVPSSYIHMGGLGPKRVLFPDDPNADASALRVIDNPDSPLDAADLVFIDPASTGFSRVMPGIAPESYFTVRTDGQQVTAFIRLWLTKHHRLSSPKYIVGESYGSIRAPEVGAQLAELPQPILLDGMMLMGQATNIIEYAQRPANILSYVLSLPTLSAIAWYHNRIDRAGRDVDQFVADARAFADTEYLNALYRGNRVAPDEKARVAAKLATFSGIPADYYITHNLRITKEQFRATLLKDRGLLLGSLDARYTAPFGPKGLAADPANRVISRIAEFFVGYIRSDLKVNWPEPYLTEPPVLDRFHWDYGGQASPFSDWPFPNRITKVMTANPRFRLFVGNGDYDTQTTIGGAEYLFDQQNWPANRTTLKFYQGGHMAYTLNATAKLFSADLRKFVTDGAIQR